MNNMERRRKTKFEEQTGVCEGCGFCLCERHHVLEYSKYGENDSDVLVCPTCHWVLGICVSALFKKSKSSYKLWNHLLKSLGDNHPRLLWAKKMLNTTIEKEIYEQVGKHIEEISSQ